MELDLRSILRLARRWWWLLLFAPVVAGFVAREVDQRIRTQAPEYAATATLLINPGQVATRTDYETNTFGELILTTSVLEPVVAELSLPFSVDDLREMVQAEPILGPDNLPSDLLRVTVVDTDPQRATSIANGVAGSFVTFMGNQGAQRSGPARAALDVHIQQTQEQITETEQQIRALEQAPDAADPASQTQLDMLRERLGQLQTILADHLVTAQTMDMSAAAAQAQLSLVDAAVVPSEPIPRGSSIRLVVPAAFAALALAVAVVALFAFLDSSVRTADELVRLTGAPLLTMVQHRRGLRPGPSQLFVVEQPSSKAAEEIRLLRTNLESTLARQYVRSVMLSSPGAGEGKSVITANLGVALAQAGFRVMLVDANLRTPSLHAIFGVSNESGLATVLSRSDESWRSIVVSTVVHNLSLLPSGRTSTNPGDLLSGPRLPEVLAEIAEAVDVILVDTPPILSTTDSLSVAADVDAVILLCRSGQTSREAVRTAAVALGQAGGQLIGVVMNRQPQQRASYTAPSSRSAENEEGHRQTMLRGPAASWPRQIGGDSEPTPLYGRIGAASQRKPRRRLIQARVGRGASRTGQHVAERPVLSEVVVEERYKRSTGSGQ